MKREDINISHFKEILEQELSSVEKELKTVGRINPDNPEDWEATPPDAGVADADRNESADKIEEFEANTAILKELESRYNDIKEALQDIENDSYGFCKVDGEPISKERLEANPSARTCLDHA